MRKALSLALLPLIALSLGAASCDDTNAEIQAKKGAARAEKIQFLENSEQDNIEARLRTTGNPNQIGFISLINETTGTPFFYTSVRGKITSSGKRLTDPVYLEEPTPSDEGTWGSSDPYVYWWNLEGAYFQTNTKYLYSSAPVRLEGGVLKVSGEGMAGVTPWQVRQERQEAERAAPPATAK